MMTTSPSFFVHAVPWLGEGEEMEKACIGKGQEGDGTVQSDRKED